MAQLVPFRCVSLTTSLKRGGVVWDGSVAQHPPPPSTCMVHRVVVYTSRKPEGSGTTVNQLLQLGRRENWIARCRVPLARRADSNVWRHGLRLHARLRFSPTTMTMTPPSFFVCEFMQVFFSQKLMNGEERGQGVWGVDVRP